MVGAGPAGAMAAYELARAGARILLLEKEALPRYKPCAGGLTAKMVPEIPFDLDPVIEDVCYDIAVSFRLGTPFLRHWGQPLVYMVMRDRFDWYLTQQVIGAGAVVLDQAIATEIVLGVSHVEVHTNAGEFRVAVLVGADGANGVVGRSLGLGEDFYCGVAWESEVVPRGTARRCWRGLIGIDLGTLAAGGYAWMFPKREHLSVGVAGRARGARQIKSYHARFVEQRGLGRSSILCQHGHRLPLRPPGSPIQAGRALLAGDAAGLIDGFTGEGIYWAVRSGKIAAAAALELLRGQTRDLTSYERRVDAELMPELVAAQRWAHIYLWAPSFCYLLLRHSEPFWRAVCQTIRGERGYKDIDAALGPLRFLAAVVPTVGAGPVERPKRRSRT